MAMPEMTKGSQCGTQMEPDIQRASQDDPQESFQKLMYSWKNNWSHDHPAVLTWVQTVEQALAAPRLPQGEIEWIDKAITALSRIKRDDFANSHNGLLASGSVIGALEFVKAARRYLSNPK